MDIKGIFNIFNPFSKDFKKANKDFKHLNIDKKVGVVAFSILSGIGTFFILGFGSVPAFRWAVKRFKTEGKGVDSQSNEERVVGKAKGSKKAPFNAGVSKQITRADVEAILALDLSPARNWTQEDFNNGSDLNKFYKLIREDKWCVDHDYLTYANKIDISKASLDDLVTLSTWYVRSDRHAEIDGEGFVTMANDGTLAAFQQRLRNCPQSPTV